MKTKYNEQNVIISLKKKKDIRIWDNNIEILLNKVFDNRTMSKIVNPAKSFDLGNGSWGKIDYLIKEHGYFLFYSARF